jgi:hypothetical protein
VNWKPEGSGLVLKKTAIAATVAARSCAMSILDLKLAGKKHPMKLYKIMQQLASSSFIKLGRCSSTTAPSPR